MKLFYSPASPYARKIRILLRELSLAVPVTEVVADPFANDPEYLAFNPLGKVPCLVLDNGDSLFDSDVIAAYLNARAGGASLMPAGENRWGEETLMSLGAGMMDSAVALRVESTKPIEQQSPLWGERHRNAILRGLAYLESAWSSVAPEVSMLTIVCACLLGYLDFRHPHLAWRETHPRLAAWYQVFSRRPSLLATEPG